MKVSRLAPSASPKAGDLDQAARDQCGARIVAQAEAVADAGGDRQYVLHRPADFGADQVFVGVDAQLAAVQALRGFRGKRGIGRRPA
jgi:hypothetical protein